MTTRIRDLHAGAIDVNSVHFDWSEGYPDKWDHYDLSECCNCGKMVAIWENQEKCPKCGEYVDAAEGPMMNYFYALPGFDPQEVGGVTKAAMRLSHLNVCLVNLQDDDAYIEDEWGLALTGGGMNLAWDICAGYVALGYLPPLYVSSQLPEFAGMTLTSKVRRVLAAARSAYRFKKWEVRSFEITLKNLTGRLKANTEARKQKAA